MAGTRPVFCRQVMPSSTGVMATVGREQASFRQVTIFSEVVPAMDGQVPTDQRDHCP